VLAPPQDLQVSETFTLRDEALDWTVTLSNQGSRPAEIGDLAVPFAFAERTGARGDIYTKKLLRHSLVNGHGSWGLLQRSNAVGPYLVMTPEGATKFEYYDSSAGAFTPYVHAQAAGAAAKAAGGNWRLPVSTLRLAPKGSSGSSSTYTFRFQWAKDVAGRARRALQGREVRHDDRARDGGARPISRRTSRSAAATRSRDSAGASRPGTRVEACRRSPASTR
jgi:hypothetical protein